MGSRNEILHLSLFQFFSVFLFRPFFLVPPVVWPFQKFRGVHCFPCFGPSHLPSRRQRKPLIQADKAASVDPSIIELWFIVVYIRCYLFFPFSSPIWFLQPHILLQLSFLESVSSIIKGEKIFNHSSSHEHNDRNIHNRLLSQSMISISLYWAH